VCQNIVAVFEMLIVCFPVRIFSLLCFGGFHGNLFLEYTVSWQWLRSRYGCEGRVSGYMHGYVAVGWKKPPFLTYSIITVLVNSFVVHWNPAFVPWHPPVNWLAAIVHILHICYLGLGWVGLGRFHFLNFPFGSVTAVKLCFWFGSVLNYFPKTYFWPEVCNLKRYRDFNEKFTPL